MAPQLSEAAKKQLKLRNRLWPEVKDSDLWIRHKSAGFITIPRLMPLIMQIMDDMSKGKKISNTYLELWCRSWDLLNFVVLSKHEEIAFHSGFQGQRNLISWREKLRILQELGFIDIKPGPNGPFSYALLLNPYRVIKRHYEEKHPGISEGVYNSLLARAEDIKATDLD